MRVCVRRAPPPVTPTPTLPRPPSVRVCAARSPLRTRPWWGLPRARPSARASARSRPRTPHARSGTAGEGLTHIAEGSGPRAPSSCSCTSQPLGRAPSPPARGGAHVHAAVRPPPSLTAAALCGWRVELHQQLCGARPAAAHHRWPASPAQPYTHRRMAGLFGVARVHKQHIRWTQQAQYAAEKLKRTSCPLQSGGMGSHT